MIFHILLHLYMYLLYYVHSTPSGDGLPQWPSLREDDAYMVLSADPHVGHKYQPRRMNYWLETLPRIAATESEGAKDEL